MQMPLAVAYKWSVLLSAKLYFECYQVNKLYANLNNLLHFFEKFAFFNLHENRKHIFMLSFCSMINAFIYSLVNVHEP